MNKTDKMLTVRDLMEILGLKKNAVINLLHREKLGMKIGKKLYIPESEFKEFVEKSRL